MKLSNLFALVLFSFSLSLMATESKVMLDSANAAYAKGDYTKAIKFYENIISKGEVAPELYFNLGDAYYKSSNLGYAILNYERAKKLLPDDEDINVNLKLANQKIEDKIEVAPQLFLTTWKNGVVDMMNEKSWSELCILLIVISLILFCVYIFTVHQGLKKLGFWGGSVLIILSVFIFFVAKHKYELTKTSSNAIITSAAATVYGSPTEKGTKLFILHEGTKVDITEDNGEWVEIKIANGNVGWLPSKSIVAI